MNQYAVIFEGPSSAEGNWSAYVPDLPGCVSVGDTLDECKGNIQEAISLHIETLTELGHPVPAPITVAGMVAAA